MNWDEIMSDPEAFKPNLDQVTASQLEDFWENTATEDQVKTAVAALEAVGVRVADRARLAKVSSTILKLGAHFLA